MPPRWYHPGMSEKQADLPEKCCLNCHFLVKTRGDDKCLVAEDRHVLRSGGTPCQDEQKHDIACLHRVWRWSSLLSPEERSDLHGEVTRDRGESCFFHPYTHGMALKPARALERRNAISRDAEKDRKLTRKAFRVAFVALIVSILATLATLIWNIWAHFHPPAR